MSENREDALAVVATLTAEQLEAVAVVIETAEVQGDYIYSDDNESVWEDNVNFTLRGLAAEVRRTHKENP